ncbi:MAG TPA: phosphodiester glycosidase family protein [Longimicrobium sp.]|nr:phosphodiester glycosidase family protein [Longimicrobium sp.]
MRKRASILLAAAAAVVAAATAATRSPDARPGRQPEPAVRVVAYGGAEYYVVHADLRRHRVRLHWKDRAGRPYGSPSALARALAAEGERVVAVTNGAIFSREMAPLGLHVERGAALVPLNRGAGTGNFFRPAPNAVFAVLRDGTARIVRRDAAVPLAARMVEGAQSGPRLVERGRTRHRFGDRRMHRTGIGVCSPTDVYLVVTRTGASLNELARLYRERLGCADAMFLDGGGVRGLVAARDTLEENVHGAFVGMISVVER